jgi:hypothetical protein
MSKSNTFENSLLLLLFNNTNIANIGDATGIRGSTVPGNLWLALHTADPGEAGSAVTNECAYTNYARVQIARSGAGFVVTASAVSPAANSDFPQAGAGANEVATHFSIVNTANGAGIILYKGIIGGSVKPCTADTGDLITSPAHGFVTDDRVIFEALEGVALPTGLVEGTRYFVLATGLTTDAFKVSATSGGAAIDVTVAGGGLVQKSLAINITVNVTPRLTTATTVTEG